MNAKERLIAILAHYIAPTAGVSVTRQECADRIESAGLLAPEWMSASDAPISKPLLCKRGNRVFIGKQVGRFEMEMDTDWSDAGEWDESGDNFYALPGWFEQAAEHEDVSWWATETPEYFQPLTMPRKEPKDA